MTFADQELLMRIEGSKHYLKNVDTLINWKQIRKLLSSLDLKRKNGFGRDCYDPEKMFRVMLIRKWNNLSDYQMEEQLKFNLMYVHICRFSFGNPAPDHSAICRWLKKGKKSTYGYKGHVSVDQETGLCG